MAAVWRRMAENSLVAVLWPLLQMLWNVMRGAHE